MFLHRSSALRRQWATASIIPRHTPARRWLSVSTRLCALKPVVLADIGEGIVECEVIQWFVEPGARVEEFSPLCEVQSDKASVEITSRFSGIVRKLHYETGEMAKVGKPFVDIDTEEAEAAQDKPIPATDAAAAASPTSGIAATPEPTQPLQPERREGGSLEAETAPKPKGKAAALATPAVRHLSRELGVDILEIDGTGRDGRVLKEDIQKYVQAQKAVVEGQAAVPQQPQAQAPSIQTETHMALSNMQAHMFRSMTRSLSIPHFVYADEIDFTNLVHLRTRLNKFLQPSSSASASPSSPSADPVVPKISYLPFIIKAASLALHQFPLLNARVDASNGKPSLIMRSVHNIGVAMDTPQGLVVPVIRDVASRTILSIAAELARLQSLAANGRLAPDDLAGGTFTVSNIGNIGGTYLSPVIVEREVAILGMGRMRAVPAFDEQDKVVKKHVCNFSWSADHRVVDGATMARAAEVMRRFVEEPDAMVMHLR